MALLAGLARNITAAVSWSSSRNFASPIEAWLSGVRTAVGATALTRTLPSHSLARLQVRAPTPALAAAYAAIGAIGRKRASEERLTVAPWVLVSAGAAARLIQNAV